MTKSILDYYAILKISPHANHQEIKAQYRTLVKDIGLDALHGDLNFAKQHPDKTLITILKRKIEEATEISKLLNEAYGVLSNPGKRSQYDQEYFRNKPPIITPSVFSLDFGVLHPGESKTLSLIIANLGGPAGTIKFNWENGQPWVKYSSKQKNSGSQFPIEVLITVTARANLDGKQKTALQVIVDGQIKTVHVSYIGATTPAYIVVPKQPDLSKTAPNPVYINRESFSPPPEPKHEPVKPNTSPIPKSRVVLNKHLLTVGGLIFFGCIGLVFFGTIFGFAVQNTQAIQRPTQEAIQQEQRFIQNPPINISIVVKKCQGFDDPNSPPCYSYINTNAIVPSITEYWPDSTIYLVDTRVNGVDVICSPYDTNQLNGNGEINKFWCTTDRDDILPPNHSNMCFDFDIDPWHTSKIITICQDIK